DCAIKAFLWMRLHQAQEILLPWITFKVRELFNNLAQLSDAHALQRFLEGFPPLFTQSFHIYKFIEWHGWLLPWISLLWLQKLFRTCRRGRWLSRQNLRMFGQFLRPVHTATRMRPPPLVKDYLSWLDITGRHNPTRF